MKKISKLLVALVAFVGICAGQASAQALKVDLDKPKIGALRSPDFAGSDINAKPFKGKNWLDIECRFRVKTGRGVTEKYIDGLTFKFYVAVQNSTGKGYFLLSKDVEYINVALDKELYASVYLSPSAVERLTGSDNVNPSVVDVVGVEVTYEGRVVAQTTTKLQEGWWKAQSPNLVPNDKFPLLNKNETPFASLWWDRFAEIRPQAK